MPGSRIACAQRALDNETGSIALLAALLIPMLLLGVGAVIDLNRAQGLREITHAAAQGAARAVVRGATDGQADAYVQSLLAVARPGAGNGVSVPASVSIRREADVSVTVEVTVQEERFNLFRAMTGQALAISAVATALIPCVPPSPRWTPVTQACPEGESGMISFDQEEQGVCASAAGPVTWATTGNQQNYSSTCTAG